MEINRGHFGCYAPPCATTKWLQRWDFMEKAGNRWWPYLGALYIVQAIKRVEGMRLVGPAWEKRSARLRSAVPATNRMKNRITDTINAMSSDMNGLTSCVKSSVNNSINNSMNNTSIKPDCRHEQG